MCATSINKPTPVPGQLPVGTVMAFAGQLDEDWLAQYGWLLCDGRSLKQDSYSDLYAVIRGAFGQIGDMFSLPDCRGIFIRGVDMGAGNDLDRGSRTAQAHGGAVGDAVGSEQTDAFASHTHAWKGDTATNYAAKQQSGRDCLKAHNAVDDTTVGTSANTGGSETRPKNVYMYYIIKYRND